MKRAHKRELNLNKSSVGCAPCLNEVLKIGRRVDKRKLNEMKIEEIKMIINSIFNNSNNENNKT